MANKKTKKPTQAKKVYMSASLITLDNKVIRPGDIVAGLSDADEKMYLDAGMIYPVDGIIPPEDDKEDNDVPPEDKQENDEVPPEDKQEEDDVPPGDKKEEDDVPPEDKKEEDENKEAKEA